MQPRSLRSQYLIIYKAFRRAYDSDPMAEETRNALLNAQLQEGLKYALMKVPVVSSAQEYQELCVAAKNKERWLNELNKKQQYLRDSGLETTTDQGCGKF